MKRVVHTYRGVETLVNWIAFVLATYLAGASVLRAGKWPNEHAWQPWTGWFVALLLSAVVVPFFALLKYFDARQEKLDKQAAEKTTEESQLDADMARLCQEMAAALARVCQGLSLDKVAVQVWLCDEASGQFDRRWKFFLPFDRLASGIVWRKGVGIAGTAWAQDRDLAVSIKALKELTLTEFEGLPNGAGYGMTYAQTQSSAYTGIIAVRLYNHEAGDTLLGMLVIDYTGDDQWDCLATAMDHPEVYTTAGACARRLSAAKFMRSDHD
ncbi:MAG TPA: hypothetical protein VNY27_10485 [Solirubrobacteraceae bacterium]|jgi:hypothetical protein|nr:hypothetical protein [Solirubrobacteraceae bacterium]